VASEDEKRGKDLANLARLLLLWLHDNELPGIHGLSGDTPPDDFELYAGTYHALSRKRLPNLWTAEPAELKRFQELRCGITHVVLVDNPHHAVQLPDGRWFTQNRIVEAQPGGRLDREGALVTVEPELDSRDPDETLGRTRNYDISYVLRRVDMVWDDFEEAVQARFKYPELLSYPDPPRPAYDLNLKEIIAPAGTVPREFRDILYYTATYKNHETIGQRDEGDHYDKWPGGTARSKKRREFRPTLLSDEYLKDCFKEYVMKKGDDVLLVELPAGRAFYRLLRNRRPRRKPSDALTVQQLPVIGTLDSRSPAQIAADKAVGTTDTPLVHPVRAVLFHCVDGGNEVPTVGRGKLDFSGGPRTRFMIDYRAYVRWYHGQKVNLGADATWFQSFVDTFFADAVYLVDLERPRPGIDLKGLVKLPDLNREELFLKPLRAAYATAQGPTQKQLKKILDWADASPYRFVFLRGTDYGPEGKPHELIGISASGDVYEWLPQRGIVTRMQLAPHWFEDLRVRLFADVLYQNTAHLLPLIAIVTWGGVIVMSGGVLGMGGVLGNLGRQTVRELGVRFAGKEIAKVAARNAAPYLVAMIVEAVVGMLPEGDSLEYKIGRRFIHGFCDGFSTGAVTHYLSEVDERLERAANLVPEVAANVALKGLPRAYLVYRKVSVAVDKLTLVVKTVQVLDDVKARRIADQLSKLSEGVGIGFLVIVFVVVYINFLVKSKQNDLDAWIDRQRKTLQHMIKETGREVATYLDGLRADIAALNLKKGEPVPTNVLLKHDEKLSQVIRDKLSKGAHDVAGVADFLVLLLREMGVENPEELRKLDLEDLLARGWAALPKATLLPEVADKFGHALGELAGTIMLERRLTPQSVQKGSSLIYGRQPHHLAKQALTGGIWRALWRFVLFPFQDLSSLSDSMRKALESQEIGKATTPGGGTFSKMANRDTAYRQLLLDLWGDSDEIARRIIKLAEDEGLSGRIKTLADNVADNKLPPHFGELIKGEHADEWPGDAVMFVLYTWLRIGMQHLLSAFELINDDKPFDRKFKIADLLDVLGIDVDLNDKEALALKALTSFTSAVSKP
jgi:hypothetical protein